MSTRKLVLYFVLVLLGVIIWNTWNKQFPPPIIKRAEQQQTQQQQSQPRSANNFAPDTYSPGSTTNSVQKQSTNQQTMTEQQHDYGNLIRVKTDVLQLAISPVGGNIVSAKLLQYPVSLQEKNTPIQILKTQSEHLYIAQSGLTNTADHMGKADIHYQSASSDYQLGSGNTLTVELKGKTNNGLDVTKIFTFKRDAYAFKEAYRIRNRSGRTWKGSIYNQFTRRNYYVKHSFLETLFHRSAATNLADNFAAISSPDTPYHKLTFAKLNEKDVDQNIQGGWAAMQQHYFVSAWVPPSDASYHYYSRSFGNGDDGENNLFILGYESPQITLAPGATTMQQSSMYIGPEVATRLDKLSPHLKLTIDYGWLAPISQLIFWVMRHINNIVGNWGWSIILVTLLIKIVFYWFSDKSYKSMARMRQVQPRLQSLKERFEGDKQGLSKATMELYKKEKVNPMGGCLPMIIQIPVFIALYYVLSESVQLRQAPFILWIHDLSVQDPYFVLPILMGVSMFVQQKLTPAPPDPMQAKMMMFLPVFFVLIFMSFPAGLVLYWLTNNILSVAQQWYVLKTFDPVKERKKKQKR